MTKHFRHSEFECKCCRKPAVHNAHLKAVLELVRHHFGNPVFITSAYRCERHNEAVGGSDTSQHLLSTAADISVQDVTPLEVVKFLESVFPDDYGIGLYDDFVHVDVRQIKARW